MDMVKKVLIVARKRFLWCSLLKVSIEFLLCLSFLVCEMTVILVNVVRIRDNT